MTLQICSGADAYSTFGHFASLTPSGSRVTAFAQPVEHNAKKRTPARLLGARPLPEYRAHNLRDLEVEVGYWRESMRPVIHSKTPLWADSHEHEAPLPAVSIDALKDNEPHFSGADGSVDAALLAGYRRCK
jgi:hypothetical protein